MPQKSFWGFRIVSFEKRCRGIELPQIYICDIVKMADSIRLGPSNAPSSSGGSYIILGVLGLFAMATLVAAVWLTLSGMKNVKMELSKVSSSNLYHSHEHEHDHDHDGDSDHDGSEDSHHSPRDDNYEGGVRSRKSPHRAQDYGSRMLKKIMVAPKEDKMNVTARIIADLLQLEDSKTVEEALSTVVTPATITVPDDEEGRTPTLAELAIHIKEGNLDAIRKRLRSPTEKTLVDLYDSLITSLEQNPAVSDDVKKKLGQIKVIKCHIKFKDDPTGMVACLTPVMTTILAPVPIEQTGIPVIRTTPAPSTPSTPSTPPANNMPNVPVINNTISVSDDGLVLNTNAGKLTFTFDRDRLNVCNAAGECKSNVLV